MKTEWYRHLWNERLYVEISLLVWALPLYIAVRPAWGEVEVRVLCFYMAVAYHREH